MGTWGAALLEGYTETRGTLVLRSRESLQSGLIPDIKSRHNVMGIEYLYEVTEGFEVQSPNSYKRLII